MAYPHASSESLFFWSKTLIIRGIATKVSLVCYNWPVEPNNTNVFFFLEPLGIGLKKFVLQEVFLPFLRILLL